MTADDMCELALALEELADMAGELGRDDTVNPAGPLVAAIRQRLETLASRMSP